MSEQTKQESIGYIVKGMMDSAIPAKAVKKAIDLLWVMVPDQKDITNYDTSNFAVFVCEKLELDNELIRDINSSVYRAFDDTPVEGAGEYFRNFVSLVMPYRNFEK
ncbi:hypothetical protein AAGG74_16440 [Bacillus mexicanus]|uniref:hypothetical protein n=1 Tax=Bacillus mexicanus TaxID=2834415 RepID=UPI003D21E40C